MGGKNPYVGETEVALPAQRYRIRFLGEDVVVEVDPARLPYSRDGRVGSLLEIALGHDVDVDHACGGVCACSTCHVIVREGLASCNEPGDAELDQLDNAPGQEVNSRLACQCVPNGTMDLVVEVPSWNRNLVSEEHD